MKESRWWRTEIATDIEVLAAVLIGALAGAAGRLTPADVLFVRIFALVSVGIIAFARPRSHGRAGWWFEIAGWTFTRTAVALSLSLLVVTLSGATGSLRFALSLWVMSAVSLLLARTILATTRRVHGGHRTLIVGGGRVAAGLARRLRQHPELGLRPVGFLDSDPLPEAWDGQAPIPLLGAPRDIAAAVAKTGATHVVLGFSRDRDAEMVKVVAECHELGLHVSVVPRLYETVNGQVTLEHLGGLPLLWLRPISHDSWQFGLKHTLDRVLALAALIALAPIMVGIALAVRLSSPGPIIFRQRRIGRGGRPFDLLKFRTMRVGASAGAGVADGADLDPARDGAAPPKGFEPRAGFAPGGVEGVDRRTPIGRFLRQTSLDELPQLINVLRGEMSIVGPRPERPEFVDRFSEEIERYPDRHRVKSGITGWAQVNGLRGQTSIADRVEWDNHYIENWSFRLECKTILRTLMEVVRFREDGPADSPQGQAGALALETVSVPSPVSPSPVSPSPVPPPPTPAPMPMPAVAEAPTRSVALTVVPAPPVEPSGPNSRAEKVTLLAEVCAGDEAPSASEAPSAFEGRSATEAAETPATTAGGGDPAESEAPAAQGELPREEELGDPTSFLLVDARLTIQEVSPRAAFLLGEQADTLLGQPLSQLLVSATSELEDPRPLTAALARARTIEGPPERVLVRPRGVFGARLEATVIPLESSETMLVSLAPASARAWARGRHVAAAVSAAVAAARSAPV